MKTTVDGRNFLISLCCFATDAHAVLVDDKHMKYRGSYSKFYIKMVNFAIMLIPNELEILSEVGFRQLVSTICANFFSPLRSSSLIASSITCFYRYMLKCANTQSRCCCVVQANI